METIMVCRHRPMRQKPPLTRIRLIFALRFIVGRDLRVPQNGRQWQKHMKNVVWGIKIERLLLYPAKTGNFRKGRMRRMGQGVRVAIRSCQRTPPGV
ncbi:MAG: hypothetical protein IAE87_18030 [Rhodobacteraceae bacterium]|jgi:hypothetical protein|nr:hypothetical protein [Paracoccaceae bacterium]